MALFKSPHSGRMPSGFYWLFGISLVITGAPIIPLFFGDLHPVKYVVVLILVPVLVVMACLMRYYQGAFNRLHYELSEAGVVINWGKNPVVIPYQEIKAFSMATLKGVNRIYGIELGGYRQGVFSIFRLGRGQLFAVGDRVVFIQTEDQLYGISPLKQDEFVKALREELQQRGIQFKEEVSKNVKKTKSGFFLDGWSMTGIVLGIGMILGMVLLIYLLSPGLPEQIPLHYNFRGEVDRFGSPEELYVMPGIALACWLLTAVIGIGLAAGDSRIRRLAVAVADGIVLLLWGILLAMVLPLL